MSRFHEVYRADISRYAGRPDMYIRIFLYLYRRAVITKCSIVRIFWKGLFRIWANRRGLELGAVNQIGRGLYLGHAFNITINPRAKIGSNCNIHKGVVIGQENRGKRKGAPTIGDSVWIGINAAIVGNITIGDDVLIAPNSFVNCDVPSHSIVYGNPCQIMNSENATQGYINNCI